jgi:hypothetical protein
MRRLTVFPLIIQPGNTFPDHEDGKKERIRYNRYTLKNLCQQTFCKILYVHVRENSHANNHVFASRKTLHAQIYASAKGQNGANMHKRIH